MLSLLSPVTKIDPNQVVQDYFDNPVGWMCNFSGSWNRFFEPNAAFVDFCRHNYGTRTFVDCGCGIGQVTKALRDAGMKVIPVDLYPTEHAVIDDIFGMDAAMFSFVDNMVGVLCRPNRGKWIHVAIIRAVEGCGTLIYCGKQSHFETDLEPLPYTVTKVLDNVGEDGDCVWVVTR